MTHLFEVSEKEMKQLHLEERKFDILLFRRPLSIGDTIIYQLVKEDTEKDENPNDIIPAEHHQKVDYIFEDTEGALKKGYIAVGFKIEI